MRLTKNFTLAEFTYSATAEREGIDNDPSPSHLANLRATALGLEQVRSILGGKPVSITSGYRSPELNALVGGVPTSSHCTGCAADISVSSMNAYEVAIILTAPECSLAFDTVILENSRNIVHISFDPRLRQRVLSQPEGPGSPFSQGIINV